MSCYRFRKASENDLTATIGIDFSAPDASGLDEAVLSQITQMLFQSAAASELEFAQQAGFSVAPLVGPGFGFTIEGYPEGQQNVADRLLDKLQRLSVDEASAKEAIQALLSRPYAGDDRAFIYSVQNIMARLKTGQSWTDQRFRERVAEVQPADIRAFVARLRARAPAMFEIAPQPGIENEKACKPAPPPTLAR